MNTQCIESFFVCIKKCRLDLVHTHELIGNSYCKRNKYTQTYVMAIITKKIAFNRVETVKADHSFKCKIYIKVKVI